MTTLHSIDILKHAVPVTKAAPKKRKQKDDVPAPEEIPEVPLDIPATKKPRTEKQLAATEKLKALNAERKAAAAKALDDQIKETERLKAQSEAILAAKKEAAAEKRRIAREAKKPPLAPIIEEPEPVKKPRKNSKPLVIQDVIKQVQVTPPTPVEPSRAPLQSVPFNRSKGKENLPPTAPVLTASERRQYEQWSKRGTCVFGGNSFGSGRRMR